MTGSQSIISWAACPVLESVPGKMGGAWVFRGTRIGYMTVLQEIGKYTVDQIVEDFPTLGREQIVEFLDFVARSAKSPQVL